MFSSSAQLGFPRRVVALYLLFCVGAILLLTVGGVAALQSLLKAQATGDALSRAGRLAAAIEIDSVTTSGDNAQQLVESARTEGRLTYCSVIGTDGRFVAHSDRSLVGAVALEPIGSQLRWGSVDGVRFTNELGQLINEYRTPLAIDGKSAGTLVMAVATPDWRSVVGELAHKAPVALVAPFGLLALGSWWLRRTADPLAAIEQRLTTIARQPSDAALVVEAIPPTSLGAVGWNRLAEAYREAEGRGAQAGLDDRLAALAAAAGGGKAREALESLSEGVAVTDALGKIDFANRAVAALLGRDESVDGAAIDELLASIAPERATSLAHDTPDVEVVSELSLATAGGERTLRLARSPLCGDATSGHVWNLRDITQQKLAEASRDQFIDTATHELRTPLANIKAYAETLAMGDALDVEEQKEFCNTINTEATRLARFVDDLLSISSMEVGTLAVQRQNVEVRRLLDEAAEKVRPLMKQRSLQFDLALAEKLGEAKLDKDKVSGLVVNLLGNAAKYTPEGGTVTLTVTRDDDALKIEVRDTGVGISDDEQAKVFDKFFRSENPEVQGQVGTGLGLSLAREIARLHRGDLTLASKLGEGSTFTAVLPV